MGIIKRIKPLVSICPKCDTENIVTQLNVESASGIDFFQNYIICKKCSYSYIFLDHLADKTIEPFAYSIEVMT
jgi:transposase-like protein